MIVILETSAEKHTAIMFNLLLLRILIANNDVIVDSFLQYKVGPLSFFFFFFFPYLSSGYDTILPFFQFN